MTRPFSISSAFSKRTARLRGATLMLLIASLLILSAGCKRLIVIPADKTVIRLQTNESFRPTIPGYFVPDARMLEILEQLSKKQLERTP